MCIFSVFFLRLCFSNSTHYLRQVCRLKTSEPITQHCLFPARRLSPPEHRSDQIERRKKCCSHTRVLTCEAVHNRRVSW